MWGLRYNSPQQRGAIAMAEAFDTKKYLEYLDKEMSIMGILSAVCVIAPGGILSTVLASDKGPANAFWSTSGFFIIAGAALSIIAALFFYRQRSTVAWFYGQICLTEVLDTDNLSKARDLLRQADSWAAWWPYSWGFTFLIAGFIEILLAVFFHLVPLHCGAWCNSHLHIIRITALVLCPFIATLTAWLQWYVLTHYRFSDDYWKDFWLDLMRRHRSVSHRGVYTRLKSSSISGVGVFAISPIPKGTYIFEPDDSPTVKIAANAIKTLPLELRRLYEDFCVLRGDEYECPASFNQLTPSWYLNHSGNPNVAADDSLKFYAVRDIEAGEELTADYGSYSENESGSEIEQFRD
jgi:uncharacterized protein